MARPVTFESRRRVAPGVVEQVAPRIRRLAAANEGPYTFTGTNTYIVGADTVAVIDPGPDDPAHVARLAAALAGERVSHILVTHTHRDHSPASRRLRALTGAPVLGFARPDVAGDDTGGAALDAGHDPDFAPDRLLGDGDTVAAGDWELAAIYTPGHTSNHLSFALAGSGALFSGDHVMGWSTTMVAPPDGDMAHYLASLKRLLARQDAVYWPGHGGEIAAPHRYVRALISHREAREAAILACVKDGLATVAEIVARVYGGLDARLHRAAALTTLAHLIHLAQRGEVAVQAPPGLDSRFAAL